MAFNPTEVENPLVQTGWHCCICQILYRVQVHHIIPRGEGGTDDIDNAIPLCPLCHDEVHTVYTPGRSTKSYSPSEIKKHRQRTIDMIQGLPADESTKSTTVATSNTVAAYQNARNLLASAEPARRVLRLAIRLRDLIISARTPAFAEGEAGRRILEAANLSSDGKTNTELIWYSRWKPIQDANAELSKEALEAEIFFGAEARELI